MFAWSETINLSWLLLWAYDKIAILPARFHFASYKMRSTSCCCTASLNLASRSFNLRCRLLIYKIQFTIRGQRANGPKTYQLEIADEEPLSMARIHLISFNSKKLYLPGMYLRTSNPRRFLKHRTVSSRTTPTDADWVPWTTPWMGRRIHWVRARPSSYITFPGLHLGIVSSRQ